MSHSKMIVIGAMASLLAASAGASATSPTTQSASGEGDAAQTYRLSNAASKAVASKNLDAMLAAAKPRPWVQENGPTFVRYVKKLTADAQPTSADVLLTYALSRDIVA